MTDLSKPLHFILFHLFNCSYLICFYFYILDGVIEILYEEGSLVRMVVNKPMAF